MGGVTHKMYFFLITSLHMGKAKQKKFYARICSKLFKIYDQIPLYDCKNMPNPPQSSKTLRGPGYPVFPYTYSYYHMCIAWTFAYVRASVCSVSRCKRYM